MSCIKEASRQGQLLHMAMHNEGGAGLTTESQFPIGEIPKPSVGRKK